MSKMSKAAVIALAGFFFLSLTAGVGSAQTPKYSLRLGHVVQPSLSWHKSAVQFSELVSTKTNGQVKVTVYPAGQLGGDREMFEGIKLGTLDMGVISVAPMGSFTSALNGLLLPFLFDDYELMLKVQLSPQMKELLGSLDEIGVKGFSVISSDFRHFANNKRPINKPEDLKGLKLRVVEAPLYVDIFKALGASVMALPYGELYTALKTGVIDGAELNFSSLYAMKLYEVVKYLSLSTFSFPAAFVMNQKIYQGFPPDIQKVIADSAWEVVPYNYKIQIADVKVHEKVLREKGMVMNAIPDVTPFRKAVEPVYQKYMDKDKRVDWFVKEVQKMKEQK